MQEKSHYPSLSHSMKNKSISKDEMRAREADELPVGL